MFDILLAIHIVTALSAGVIAINALLLIVRRQSRGLVRNAKLLSLTFIAQIFSGSMLGLLSPTFSIVQFCSNIGLYVALYAFVMLAIYWNAIPHGSAMGLHSNMNRRRRFLFQKNSHGAAREYQSSLGRGSTGDLVYFALKPSTTPMFPYRYAYLSAVTVFLFPLLVLLVRAPMS